MCHIKMTLNWGNTDTLHVWLIISSIMLEHSMPIWSVYTIQDICSCIYASEDITTLIQSLRKHLPEKTAQSQDE